MNKDLHILVQEVILQDRHSAHEIAKGLNKPYSTLMRECNPYDTKAKLGAHTLLDLMVFTGNITPLCFMANILGYKVVRMENAQDKRGEEHEG